MLFLLVFLSSWFLWAVYILHNQIGSLPNVKKAILVFYPHTSTLEALIYSFLALKKNTSFIAANDVANGPEIKEYLPNFPDNVISDTINAAWTSFVKFCNGIPVSRDTNNNTSDTISLIQEKLDQNDKCWVAISPEQVITKKNTINPGFYMLAKKLKLPIVLLKFDYASCTHEYSEPIHPSTSIFNDMKKMRNFYSNSRGLWPSSTNPFKLEIETKL